MKILKNKDFIDFISLIMILIAMLMVILSITKLSDNKKIQCTKNGGYVVEDFIGLYDQCIYKGVDK